MTNTSAIAEHYERSDLGEAIVGALKAAGKDVDHLTTEDLAPMCGALAHVCFGPWFGASTRSKLWTLPYPVPVRIVSFIDSNEIPSFAA
jgi:hypothetical protein